MGTLRPFSSLHPLRKGRGSQCQVIRKKTAKISKKWNISIYICRKKKSCHLLPKVMIDLPFEGRKVEGGQKKQMMRECHRREVEGKKPSLNQLILALEN